MRHYSLSRLKDINTFTDVRFLKPLKPLLSLTLSSKGKNSLQASSPIWASEASLARTREPAAKLRRDPRFRVSSRVPPACTFHDIPQMASLLT